MTTIKQNYTIGICDILGFTKLVKERPLEEVVENHLGWLRKSLHHSIHKDNFPGEIPSLQQLRGQSKLGVVWFSDTIGIYTLEDSDDNLQTLMSAVCWLLFETILRGTTHIRCGISYGEAYIDVDNSIFVGQPIIDAYHLQQAQLWSGGALTSEAVRRIPEVARNGKFPYDWPVVPYDVPLREGENSKFAINWTLGLHLSPFELRWSEQSKDPLPSDWQETPDVCEKLQNTRIFHDKICRYCNKRANYRLAL